MLWITKLKIRNLYRIQKAELDLSEPGFYYVLGINKDGGSKSNGAGKSSIFNAIEWCLYGTTSRSGASAGDSVIRPGSKNGTMVELEFSNNSSVVTIVRKRKWGSNKESSLVIYRDGEEDRIDLSGKGVKDTTERIIDIIGVDYDTFRRTYILPQQGIPPFGSLTDKALKTFFVERFLELDWIDECFSVASSKLKLIENESSALQKDMEGQKVHLEKIEQYLSDAIKYDKDWREENREIIKLLKQEIKDLEKTKKKEEKGAKANKEKLDEVRDCISEVYNDTLEANKRLAQLIRKEQKLISESMSKESLVKDLERQVDKIQERIKNQNDMVGSQCDKCGNKIKKNNVEFLNKSNLKSLKDSEEALKRAKINLGTPGQLNDVRRAVKEVEAEIEDLNKESERLYNEKAKYSDSETKQELIKVISLNIENTKKRLKKAEDSESPYSSQILDYKGESAAIKKSIKEAEVRIGQLQKEVAQYKFWKLGFSPQGLQSFILDSVTPKLNERIKKYLDVLSSGVLYAQFDTVTKLKSGEYREKFRLEAGSTTGALDYQSLSGGEQRRVDLAVALAIRDFKKEMSGKSIELLVLDEPFNSLDQQGISDVLTLLKGAFVDIPLYLISHHELDSSLFTGGLVVEKEDGISKIRAA